MENLDYASMAIDEMNSMDYADATETEQSLKLAMAYAAIAQSVASQRIAAALERLAVCVVPLLNGDNALNIYNND